LKAAQTNNVGNNENANFLQPCEKTTGKNCFIVFLSEQFWTVQTYNKTLLFFQSKSERGFASRASTCNFLPKAAAFPPPK
jgi:hypothetical protein